MTPPWSGRRRTGLWPPRGGRPSCSASPAARRGGSRRKSTRRWAKLVSGRSRFRLLVVDQFLDFARPRVAVGIVARRIAGDRVGAVGVRAMVEQQLHDPRIAALDGDDQRRFAGLVGLVDLCA